MSGRKILTLGFVIGIGVLNGYYVFEPTFREEAQRRSPLDLSQTVQENKAQQSGATGKDPLGNAGSKKTS